MEIETFTIKLPLVEVIYHQPPGEYNTLLQTTGEVLEEYCSRTHNYTIQLEHFDHQQNELIQHSIHTDMPTWLDQLDAHSRDEVARQFVSYCQNLDVTQHPVYFYE